MTRACIPLIALTACVANPARGVGPRPGAARIQIDDNSTTVTNFIPGAGYSRERVSWKDWRYLDGKHDIDEQDWWRLTDPAVSAEIERARGRAARQQQLGWGLAIGGSLAGMVPLLYRPDEGGGRAAAYGVAVLGSVAITIGSLLVVRGATAMKRRIMPLSRAAEAADEVVQCFNGRRCRTVDKDAP